MSEAATRPKSVNNGRREQVRFGPYRGIAGVVEHGGLTRVAFFGEYREMRDVKTGTIGGEPYRVDSAERSDPKKGGIDGMVVLTVAPASPPATQRQTAVTP